MGRNFDDPSVREDIKSRPFEVIRGENNRPEIRVQFKGEIVTYSPEYISSLILGEFKRVAEEFLGHAINSVVLTVVSFLKLHCIE